MMVRRMTMTRMISSVSSRGDGENIVKREGGKR